MKLEDIGFYTLSDARAANVSATSPMMRGEIILTDRCNFKCPYCRGLRYPGDLDFETAVTTIETWTRDNLQNIRFSGGEPTMYKGLSKLVKMSKRQGVQRIAISTNGSRPWRIYEELLDAGVNDFSVSLDACCASEAKKMAGGVDRWQRLVENLRKLASRSYTTVGVVLTEDNLDSVMDIITFAHDLGIADIRVIPAAQEGALLKNTESLSQDILQKHPILAYRMRRALEGKAVRGIKDSGVRCHLVKDDSAVMGGHHFPCVIYMREQGDPIGKVGPNMHQERLAWFEKHRPVDDFICKNNCLDVCVAHNRRCEELSSC